MKIPCTLGITLLSCLFSFNLYSQVPGVNLDANNVKARINADGLLFNLNGSDAGFIVPNDGFYNHSTIFSSSLWIGGISNHQIYMAANTYRQSGTEFISGPVSALYDTTYKKRYNTLWRISKAQIDIHRLNYNSPGYILPAEIANWPAHGDTSKGEAKNLAPYYDFNHNNTYDPAAGDYPLIRGDLAVFFMYNDDTIHHETKSKPMQLEIHGMAYAFNTSSDTALYHTVFVNYKIFNRSPRTYDSAYIGSFVDFDLGNYADDYVGCVPGDNLFYVYNGDDEDEGILGYGLVPPAQGVMFLNQPLNGFSVYNNSLVGINGIPDTTSDFYNYLQGKWKNGTNIHYGGNGTGAGTATRFMYPGSSDPNGGPLWSEASASNAPGDRRGLGIVGPFTLYPDTMICFDIAYVYGREASFTGAASTGVMYANSLHVKNFFQAQNFSCSAPLQTSIGKQKVAQKSPVLYPNPATNEITILVEPGKLHELEMFDLNGKRLLSTLLPSARNVFNIADFPKGLIIYKISDGERVATGKFVKE